MNCLEKIKTAPGNKILNSIQNLEKICEMNLFIKFFEF